VRGIGVAERRLGGRLLCWHCDRAVRSAPRAKAIAGRLAIPTPERRRCICPVAALRRRRASWLLRHGWSSLPRCASDARDSSHPASTPVAAPPRERAPGALASRHGSGGEQALSRLPQSRQRRAAAVADHDTRPSTAWRCSPLANLRFAPRPPRETCIGVGAVVELFGVDGRNVGPGGASRTRRARKLVLVAGGR